MNSKRAHIIALAGPNGAGKSTTAPYLLRGEIDVKEFINADVIAQDNPGMSVIEAGRTMLSRMKKLERERVNFAFESTLAARSFAQKLIMLKESGYAFHIVFLWLPNEDFAINRVAERVRMGGHGIPEDTIKRRYHAGLSNFFELYQEIADTWYFYDNSEEAPKLVAYGKGTKEHIVKNKTIWHNIVKQYGKKERR